VVVATRDDPAAIRRRVEDCRQANYPSDLVEIVIALDASAATDPRDLWFEGQDVRVVTGDMPGGKAATLNAGVRASSGDILVFSDTAQRFEPDTILELVTALADDRFAAVSGRLELPGTKEGPSLVERYWGLERWLREREARLHSCIGVTGAVWAMPRALWVPLPAGLILDDLFTPMRLVLAGHRIAFSERARAIETRTSQAGNEYRRKVRTLTGVLQLCAWLPGVLSPFSNPVWAQFVAHKLLRLLTPYLVIAAAAGIMVEVAAVIGPAAAAALVLAPLGIACVPKRTGLPRMLREGLLMQTAVVVAAANGVVGRWEVWSAPATGAALAAASGLLPPSTPDGRPTPDL
jgi:cellulose synthase/poly-beta-1,6-N-acetylglucosamine synthase-like glycosyltransferase